MRNYLMVIASFSDNSQNRKTVVPSQSNQILTMPVHQLVSQIKVRSLSLGTRSIYSYDLEDAPRLDGRC